MTAWDPPQQASAEGSDVATALTVDPFNSLAAHYGMLLGVSDFQVIGANPRGKMRLHQWPSTPWVARSRSVPRCVWISTRGFRIG